ncbi:MAG: RidA family protein [Chloroflexi bacterium]|nr:RidA family protein [Chloroflexota bacterium]
MPDVEAKLKELRIELPPPAQRPPTNPLVSSVRVGNLVWLSGHTSRTRGKLGRDLTADQGYEAARECAAGLLSSLKAEIGSLDGVRRVVKLLSMVNATEDFTDHPRVANGCSDVFVALWGDLGKHCRSAVGMASLPGGCAVEMEAIIEVEG